MVHIRMVHIRQLAIVIGIGLSLSGIALAQTTPSTIDPDDSRRQNRIERFRRGERRILRRQGLKMQKALDLSEEQRQLMRNIRQRQFDSSKAQREELMQLGEKRRAGTLTEEDRQRAKALHSEMRTLRQNLRSEVEGILTTEQRLKMDELKKERQERRAERSERRRGKMKL